MTKRFQVMQTDYPDGYEGGVDIIVFETDDISEANREAYELSVPGNTCWVRDIKPDIKKL